MAAEHSFGTKIEYADDAIFTSPVEVTLVQSVDSEDLNITKTPTHHLRSTNALKTRIPGLVEDGDLVAEVQYDEAKYSALATLALARTSKYWRVTLPGGSTLIGQGFITRLGRPRANDDALIVYALAVAPEAGWTFTQV